MLFEILKIILTQIHLFIDKWVDKIDNHILGLFQAIVDGCATKFGITILALRILALVGFGVATVINYYLSHDLSFLWMSVRFLIGASVITVLIGFFPMPNLGAEEEARAQVFRVFLTLVTVFLVGYGIFAHLSWGDRGMFFSYITLWAWAYLMCCNRRPPGKKFKEFIRDLVESLQGRIFQPIPRKA